MNKDYKLIKARENWVRIDNALSEVNIVIENNFNNAKLVSECLNIFSDLQYTKQELEEEIESLGGCL